jgi:hypothetical protein
MPTTENKDSRPKTTRSIIDSNPSPAQGNLSDKANDLGMPPLRQDSRLKRPIASLRTGGPHTSEGRARSSLNAIKHGGYVTAKTACLDYQQILGELTQRINPVGAVEEGVVESIAIELFRLSMLGKLEVERLQSAVCAEVGTLALAQALDYPWAQTHPDELRNPPQLATLRNRLAPYLESQLASLQAQCGASPSESDSRTIEALRLAVQDMAEGAGAGDDEPDDTHPEPEYLDELDRHMRAVASGHDLLHNAMAVPADVQHLVDYWLYRNRRRIEATRRELQVAQMVMVLTSDGVRRARSHAMRQLDDCMHLLEILQGVPLDLGETSRDWLATQRKKARLSR